MSNFTCPHCGTNIIDSPRGYITGCEHYPIDHGPQRQPSSVRKVMSEAAAARRDMAAIAKERHAQLWPLVEQIIADGRVDPPTNPNPLKRTAK